MPVDKSLCTISSTEFPLRQTHKEKQSTQLDRIKTNDQMRKWCVKKKNLNVAKCRIWNVKKSSTY